MGIVSRAHVLHARVQHLGEDRAVPLVLKHWAAYVMVTSLKHGLLTEGAIGPLDQAAISGLDKALTREEASPA